MWIEMTHSTDWNIITGIFTNSVPRDSLSVLTAIFPGEPELASFIEAKDDGSAGDNWSY